MKKIIQSALLLLLLFSLSNLGYAQVAYSSFTCTHQPLLATSNVGTTGNNQTICITVAGYRGTISVNNSGTRIVVAPGASISSNATINFSHPNTNFFNYGTWNEPLDNSWSMGRFENYGTVNIGNNTFAFDGTTDSYAQFSLNGSNPSFTGRISLSNSATINIQAGTATLGNGLNLQGGTHTIGSSATLTINGTFEINSNTFTNNGSVTVNNSDVNLTTPNARVINNGTFNIASQGENLVVTTNAIFTNFGTFTTARQSMVKLDGTFDNRAGATAQIGTRTQDNALETTGSGHFINSGTATITGKVKSDNDITNNAGGTLTINGEFEAPGGSSTIINNGNLAVTGGNTFELGGSATFTNGPTGVATFDAGVETGGNSTFTNNGSLTANGNFENNSRVITGANSTTNITGNFEQGGGTTLTNAGVFQVTGNITSEYATINTSGTVTSGGTFRVEGGNVNNSNSSTCASVCGTNSITLTNGGRINQGVAVCRTPTGGTNNGTVVAPPTSQPANLSLVRTGTTVDGTFTAAADGNSYLILMQQGSAVSTNPQSFITYAVGDLVGSAKVMAVVNNRTTTNFSTSVAGFCGTLHFAVYTMNVPTTDNCGKVTYNVSNPSRSSLSVPALGGSLIGGRAVCINDNDNRPTLTLTNFSGTVNRWQQSIDNGTTWTNIANTENANAYLTPAVAVTTWYRAVVRCENNTDVFSAHTIVNVASATGTWIGKNANWSNTANWCGTLPTSGTNVIIPANAPIMPTVDINNAACNNLTLEGSLTVANNMRVTVSGNITLNNNSQLIGNSGSQVQANEVIQNSGSINMNPNSTFIYAGNPAKTFASGAYGNLTATGTGSKTFKSEATTRIAGTLNINGAIVTTGSSVCFDGTAAQTIPTANFNNLICRNSIKTISGNTTVEGSLEVSEAAKINLNARQLTISGTVSANGSNFISDANAEIIITGNGALGGSILFDNSFKQIGKLTINRTNLPTVTLASDLQVTNELVLNNSSLNTGSFTLDLGTTGKITGETPTNFVRGTVRSVKTMPANTAADFGGIGYEIAAGPEDLGTVTITRRTATTPVFNITNVPNSIFRGWTVNITGSQPSSGRKVTLTWYASEDNGIDLGQFNVYRRNTPASPWESLLPKAADFVQNGNIRTVSVDTDHFSDYGVGPGNDPLPVKLAYFKAQAIGEKVELVWSTINEVNNQEFVIERSTDGVNYEKITTVAGAGNSSTARRYSHSDKPGMGSFYYRLRQIDFDGKFEVFPAVSVNLTGATLMPRLTILPNPCTDRAALSFIYQARKEYNIIVTDMQGKEMLNKIVVPRQQEVVQDIDVNWLPAGTYLVNIVSEDGTSAARMIKK